MSARAPDGPLEDREIVAHLHRRINHSLNREDGGLSEERENNLNRYRAKNPASEPGRSEYVTWEVFEYTEEMMPFLMELIFGTRNPIKFPAKGEQDVDRARRESDIVSHYLFKRPNSFMTWHSHFKSALLDPAAYLKVHCDTSPRPTYHEYDNISTMAMAMLLAPDRKWEGIEIDETTPDDTPDMQKQYSFKGTEIREEPRYYVDPVPPEQMLVDRDATTIDLDDVFTDGFLCHRYDESFTNLVARGYDAELLEQMGDTDFRVKYNDERVNRQDREDERPDQSVPRDYSTRRFTVYECYVTMDLDGTGLAQSWRIVMIGSEIFEKEKTSYQPFIATTGIPLPFKHAGMAPAEPVVDIQTLSTKLTRIGLNDQYRNETRRVYMDKNARTPHTPTQINNPQAAVVEVKGNPHQAIKEEPQFSILQENLAMQQKVQDMKRLRTGIAPENALNPDVLRDAPAHNVLGSFSRITTRQLAMGRILCETSVTKAAVKMRQLLRMHGGKESIEFYGEFIEFDPSDWGERGEAVVGEMIGFASKAQMIQGLTQLLGLQREAAEQGLSNPMMIYNTLRQIVEASELGFVGQYFVEPNPEKGWKPPPSKPDPQMRAVEAQIEAVKMQEQTKQLQIKTEAQAQAARNATDLQKVRVDGQRIMADAQLKRTEARMDATFLVEQKQAEVEKLIEEIALLRLQRAKLVADTEKVEAETEKTEVEADHVGEESPGGNEDEGA